MQPCFCCHRCCCCRACSWRAWHGNRQARLLPAQTGGACRRLPLPAPECCKRWWRTHLGLCQLLWRCLPHHAILYDGCSQFVAHLGGQAAVATLSAMCIQHREPYHHEAVSLRACCASVCSVGSRANSGNVLSSAWVVCLQAAACGASGSQPDVGKPLRAPAFAPMGASSNPPLYSSGVPPTPSRPQPTTPATHARVPRASPCRRPPTATPCCPPAARPARRRRGWA